MTGRYRWRDVEATAHRLTRSDRRTLLLLVHLPLIWEAAVERLYGLRGRASVYRSLARLRGMDLIADMRPALGPRRNPGLLYLTDFGIATVATDQQVDPDGLARRAKLRGTDLADRLRGLPQLLALYELLVSVAASKGGRIDLLTWEQPWRRTFSRPMRRSSLAVEMPAHAIISWDNHAAAFLLLPDLAASPLDVHRQTLAHLLAFRQQAAEPTPLVVIATTAARQHAWLRLLDGVARTQSAAPLAARVMTWPELRDGVPPVHLTDVRAASTEANLVTRLQVTACAEATADGLLRFAMVKCAVPSLR